MGKGLAVVGILASVAAMMAMLVLATEFATALLVLPVLIAGSVLLVMERTVASAIAGLLVLALAVVAALGLMGSVTTEGGGTTDFGFSQSSGRVLAIAACLAIPLAAIVVRWHSIEPQPLAYVGIFCAAVSLLLVVLRRDSLVDQSDLLTVASSLVPLGSIVSMVGILRGAEEPAVGEPAP